MIIFFTVFYVIVSVNHCRCRTGDIGISYSAEDNDRGGGKHGKASVVAPRCWRRTDPNEIAPHEHDVAERHSRQTVGVSADSGRRAADVAVRMV